MAERTINSKTEPAKRLAASLKFSVSGRFLSEFNPLLGLACILDPAYKGLEFLPENHPWGNLIMGLLHDLDSTASSSTSTASSSTSPASVLTPLQKQKQKRKVSPHKESTRYMATDTHGTALLEWWKAHSSSFPTLARSARKILAIPASSAAVERFFSKSGQLVNERRTCLTPDRVSQLMSAHFAARRLNEKKEKQ